MDGVNPPPTKLSDARSGELQQGGPSGQDSVAHQSEPPTQIGNDSSPEPRANGANQSTAWVPRPKRIACTICRKRKLRCDGNKPSCGTCSRLGHDCAYDEVRKKSGPKRGYVKLLEARLGITIFPSPCFLCLITVNCGPLLMYLFPPCFSPSRNLTQISRLRGCLPKVSRAHRFQPSTSCIWQCG